MKPDDIRVIEFTKFLARGIGSIQQVIIYNETVISEAEIREHITNGLWEPSDLFIYTTKEQYENVFGPINHPE